MENKYYQYIRTNISIQSICEKFGIPVFSGVSVDTCNCPFHNDTHPSMALYGDTNRAYCFACKKTWDNFLFVEEKLNIGFDEAVKWFENEFPELLLKRAELLISIKGKRLGTAYDIAYNIYSKMTEQEKKQLELFSSERKFKADNLETKGVFFSSASKIKNCLNPEEDIEEFSKLRDAELLFQLPLQERDITPRYSDYYSQDGIMITIRDTAGNVVGFSQRSVEESKYKYRFTKRLPKGNLLYRLNEVKTRISRIKKDSIELYLVEGVFDALRLETMGKMAVAVMGSHLTQNQALELEKCLAASGKIVFLHIFMDNDEAGKTGNYQTLQNLWKSSYFRGMYIDVLFPHNFSIKDPDDYYKSYPLKKEVKYRPIDFLTRYALGEKFECDNQKTLEEQYEKLDIEDKIIVLNKISYIMPRNAWKEVFEAYENWDISEDYFYDKVKKYVEGIKEKAKSSFEAVEPENLSQFQKALQLTKTGYDKESLPLDSLSWERIATCADAFFKYFQELFQNNKHINTPLLSMRFPKKIGEEREKMMFIHERLIMQQYVLNELLGLGYGGYELYIPAVRFSMNAGDSMVYTTGYGEQEEEQETVSFAYQIYMGTLCGSEVCERGIFRNYYDCWKDYIRFIQEGIECLESEKVYRIKLDIQKFYDNIPIFALRNALAGCLKEALKADSSKFSLFQDGKTNTAERVIDWILEEIYESRYYDAETGEECNKEYDTVGIPQGPDLSAYLANIVLFNIDRKVSDYVRAENRKAKEGTIRVRYARYVDDMVIISSSADIVIHLKNLISSMLYEMGLSLSPKTDQADNITKEDAYDWTLSEKGGLGVSAIYDFPDDTLDNILEEYEEYEVTDRRRALQLLQSITHSFALIGDENLIVDKSVIDIFFQTKEVKFNDIVRISEILLYFAVTQDMDGELWEKFCVLWNEGKKSSSSDSLFQYERIEGFAFIEACNRALKRQPYEMRVVDNFKTWKKIQEYIAKFWSDENLVENFIHSEFLHGILKRNRWVMKLRLMELMACMKGTQESRVNISKEIRVDNEYSRRWNYTLAGSSQDIYKDIQIKGWEYIKDNQVLYAFHYATVVLSCIGSAAEFKNIQTLFLTSEFKPQIMDMENGILGQCMKCWFSASGSEDKTDKQVLRIALLVLISCLHDTVKAEIVGEIANLKDYIFQEDKDSEVKCVPAVQGAEYPGLIAMSMEAGNSSKIYNVKRVQFIQDNTVVPMENWRLTTNKEKLDSYQLILDSGFKTLETYFKDASDERLEVILGRILSIFKKLYPYIINIQEMYPAMRLILSKRNVLIREKNGKIEFRIAAYLVKRENSRSGVMTEKEDGVFIFEPLNGNEDYFWQAGCLLRDVCGFEKIRLEYLDGRKDDADKQIIEMMEYTFHRLTGAAINRNSRYKGVHSYKKSVERAIERTRIFIENESFRDILLEDNRIIDSFISSRMGNENYLYLPAVCSYSTGIWAKGYFRKNFQNLMGLASKVFNVKEEEFPGRRVPRLYLFMANCIRSIYTIDSLNGKEFLGLKVLETGLRANSVLVHLRMQTLEIIESLDERERKQLENEISNLPFGNLGLDGSETLITGRKKISDILIRLLHGENEKGIGRLTHLGWLIILDWLLEYQNCMDETISDRLRRVVQEIVNDSEKEEGTFPFEQMNNFFNIWSYESTREKYQLLKSIDSAAEIIVEVKKEENYYQEINHKGKVIVNLDKRIERPYYFLTYSKLDDSPMPVEQDMDETEKKCYTISKRKDKIVGVSTIENSLGQLLQKWETIDKAHENEEKEELNVENSKEKAVLNLDLETKKTSLAYKCKDRDDTELLEGLNYIEEEQDRSLEARKKEFGHTDRIAFFQFKTECTYYHPKIELCKNSKIEYQHGYSCYEFRRRKLLEEVFKACSKLKVDILLLPEYSVRPETVVWMYQQIADNNYEFSIWAGTFRIPYGYQFDTGYFSNDFFNKEPYYHAAILPVISKDEHKKLNIICKHIKKYPSIALEEDINPYAISDDNNNFEPVMKNISDFGEARSHVTELICAELFALSSPGNIVSFKREALKLYLKYKAGKPHDEISLKREMDGFSARMMKDISTYGEAISLYRDERIVERKSILLVPACTTRAVDYYVLGQANYLGSGGNMVFCNCAGNGLNGGSCFIGQDSWDKYSSSEESIFKMKTSIYHGLQPGIYKQALTGHNRGALGKYEQALVVCDVMPELDRRKPNPESMCKALEVVAHIPILEECVHTPICMEKCICKGDNFLCQMKLDEEEWSRQETFGWIRDISKALRKEGGRTTSAEDDSPNEIADNLVRLGNKYGSEWLAERGRQYARGHRLYPRHWTPETAVDWRYVEIDYGEFFSEIEEKKSGCMIQIPNDKGGKREDIWK